VSLHKVLEVNSIARLLQVPLSCPFISSSPTMATSIVDQPGDVRLFAMTGRSGGIGCIILPALYSRGRGLDI
jgi:hypothetical protein